MAYQSWMHACLACNAEKEQPRKPKIRMISIAPSGKKAGKQLGKNMESSRRYILQAEIEYWHEMLHINRSRLSEQKESEMRFFLKRALRELNGQDTEIPPIAA